MGRNMSAKRLTAMLISSEMLCSWLGYERPASAERWLRKHKIPYWLAKDQKPVTTLRALEMELLPEEQNTDWDFA